VVVVPLVTLGHVVVEQPRGGNEIPPGEYWARSPGGRIVLDAGWGTWSSSGTKKASGR